MTERRIVRIKKLRDTDEWRVCVIVNGTRDEALDYFTSDRDDALETRNEMIRAMCEDGFVLQGVLNPLLTAPVLLLR